MSLMPSPSSKQSSLPLLMPGLLPRPHRRFNITAQRFSLTWLKRFVRGNEVGLVLAGAMVGIASGCAVTAMSITSHHLHELAMGVSDGERLTVSDPNQKFRFLIAPIIGGILLGLLQFLLSMKRKKQIVDPIEANALHGGRLSLTDSILVAVQNLISNGSGASVGLEAGYTQLASGIASKFGYKLQLRRSDLRILVGCGAAGAIAAAFNAPLTGAFYAFELIIGTYTILSLTPVVVSALLSTLVARLLSGNDVTIDVGHFGSVAPADYLPAILLGAFCAGIGILIMQGVAFIEELARKSSLAPPLRPALGGIAVGLLAMISPQVLSAGHAALHLNLENTVPLQALILVFVLKSLASAISIGSGFRGGLFFASLFMGALLGKIFAYSEPYFDHAALTPVVYAVVGMSSLAVAIIGGPLTMTFLALEITGDFAITALALAAVITSSLVVRTTFGYSFATWRFHLRGENIRSAHDIGWMRDLTVGRMMREDIRTVKSTLTVERLREQFPLGSAQRVVLVDDNGQYAGIVIVADIYASPPTETDAVQNLDPYVRHGHDFLQPRMNAKQAVELFETTKGEALAVVNDPFERKVVGLLTESHTLRRYNEELDRRRREMSGEM
jgi:CIC family chloride channel protein